MIELGNTLEQVGDLRPTRRDLAEYRPGRETDRRAAARGGDDPALAAKKQQLATFLERGEQPDPGSPRGSVFDAEV